MEAKRNVEECNSHGPWGYPHGVEWVYLPTGLIKKITIRHGSYVDSIKFQTSCNTCRVGGSASSFSGGYQKDTICFGYPDEYLVSLSGTFGYCANSPVVKSICFRTNENSYGPYGTVTCPDRDTPFSYDGKGEVIVGFHGHRNQYNGLLTAIGVYMMPKSLVSIQYSARKDKTMHELCSSKPGMVIPRHPGPWGAVGGNPWDDGVFFTIKQVNVHVGMVNTVNVIYALQFEYLKRDGKSVMSELHGETSGTEIKLVNLDVEDEYLIGISGYYGPVEGYNGLEAIASISFHTNKRTHGPYGKERGAGHVFYTSMFFILQQLLLGKWLVFMAGIMVLRVQLVSIWNISEDVAKVCNSA